MFGRYACVAVVCGCLAAGYAFWGCEGDQGPPGPTGPAGQQGIPGPAILNIIATMEIHDDTAGSTWSTFNMNVYNAPSIPRVRLNDVTVMPVDDWMSEGGVLTYSRSIIPADYDSAILDITYTRLGGLIGAASSRISLPSLFSVIDSAVTVTVGDDVTAEWETSEGAEGFWVYRSFTFEYVDTNAAERVIEIMSDTVLAEDDTALVVSASEIFPDPAEIDSVIYFSGRVSIRAVTGPWLPGEVDNISGDAFGVFVGATEARHILVSLTGARAASMTPGPGEKGGRHGTTEEAFRRRVLELAYPQITR